MAAYKAIISGYNWNTLPTLKPQRAPIFLTYSFPKVGGWSDFSFKPFNKADQATAKYALRQWANASGIRLFETESGNADITFSWYYSTKNTVAHADFPELSSPEDHQSGRFLQDDYDVGVYFNRASRTELNKNKSYKTYVMLHEIGHAVGLKHPFHKMKYNKKLMSEHLDHSRNTVMSYDNSDSDIYPTKLQQFDKIAIKELYGPNSADGKHVSSWSWDSQTETLTQVGMAGADRIHGTAVQDRILGLDGNDQIYGRNGKDTLNGGAGNDTLTGGYGNDTFVFDSPLNPVTNVDKITDLQHHDVINLSSEIFVGLSIGPLSRDHFSYIGSANDKDDRIVHDESSGQLFYDPDGSGSVEQIHFATIATFGRLFLDYAYFYVI